MDMSVGVEEGELVDTRLELVAPEEPHLRVGEQERVGDIDIPIVHERVGHEASFHVVGGHKFGSHHIVLHGIHIEHHSRWERLRHVEFQFLLVRRGEDHSHLLRGWHKFEKPPSVLSARHDVERVAIGIDHLSHECHRQMVLVEHSESHAAHQSFDHFSAFRIDVDLIAPTLPAFLLHRIERGDAVVGQLTLRESLIVGKVVDDGVGIVALLLRLVEDRDDA